MYNNDATKHLSVSKSMFPAFHLTEDNNNNNKRLGYAEEGEGQ